MSDYESFQTFRKVENFTVYCILHLDSIVIELILVDVSYFPRAMLTCKNIESKVKLGIKNLIWWENTVYEGHITLACKVMPESHCGRH